MVSRMLVLLLCEQVTQIIPVIAVSNIVQKQKKIKFEFRSLNILFKLDIIRPFVYRV